MKRHKQCPKCGSRKVGYAVNDLGSSKTLLVGQAVRSENWLCVECGYVEVYAIDIADVDWASTLDQFFGPMETGAYR
jgi:predicted nucleic-acid-binding Zn-ribbon protein